MPLTPEANLCRYISLIQRASPCLDSLDKFLGLDIIHAMDTRNTISVVRMSAIVPIYTLFSPLIDKRNTPNG